MRSYESVLAASVERTASSRIGRVLDESSSSPFPLLLCRPHGPSPSNRMPQSLLVENRMDVKCPVMADLPSCRNRWIGALQSSFLIILVILGDEDAMTMRIGGGARTTSGNAALAIKLPSMPFPSHSLSLPLVCLLLLKFCLAFVCVFLIVVDPFD